MVFNIYKSVDVVQFTRQENRLRVARHVIARSSLKGRMKYETLIDWENNFNSECKRNEPSSDERYTHRLPERVRSICNAWAMPIGHCCVCSGSRNLSFDAISTIYFSTWICRPATWDVRGARAFRLHVGNWVNLKYAQFQNRDKMSIILFESALSSSSHHHCLGIGNVCKTHSAQRTMHIAHAADGDVRQGRQKWICLISQLTQELIMFEETNIYWWLKLGEEPNSHPIIHSWALTSSTFHISYCTMYLYSVHTRDASKETAERHDVHSSSTTISKKRKMVCSVRLCDVWWKWWSAEYDRLCECIGMCKSNSIDTICWYCTIGFKVLIA